MFFKYNYKKYLNDIEAITYDKEGIELLHDFCEFISNDEESHHFLLGHFTLVGCLFFENFTTIPSEATNVKPKDHMRDLSNLFLKNASSIGFVIDSESAKNAFQEYFVTSVNNLVGTNVNAQISSEQYLDDPIARITYIRSVNHDVLENMKCITKLLKTLS